ncbi:MAG: HupE/UreJ family protein [Myxococcales bacterium]|nr:HupE/UreJ family protein [Myxococcales bacterium]
MKAFACALLAAFAFGTGGAQAHSRSQSHSTWSERDGRVVVSWSILAREVTRLPAAGRSEAALGGVLAEHLATSITVTRGGVVCTPSAPARPLNARPGHLRAELRFACGEVGALEVENRAFFEQAPSHVHFARMTGGEGAVEHLFTDVERRRILLDEDGGSAEPAGASFRGYVRLGFEHILGGLDHIAFLLALLLLGGRLRDILFVVTGFTLGHSMSLSLAVLGWVRVDTGLVESLIGFSIALVAAENLSLRAGLNASLATVGAAGLAAWAGLALVAGTGPPAWTLAGLALFVFCYLQYADTPEAARRIRPSLTLLFGWVHGFGFATVLTEIGIPQDRLFAGLLGFNLGVELGQIMIVVALVALPFLGSRLLDRFEPRTWADVLSAGLCATGLYWFFERAYS